MVYVEGGNSPTHKHETAESAQVEAARLTEKEGKTTYILQAVYGYEVAANPILMRAVE